MAIKKVVDTEFWKDDKVGDMSPEEKLFFLYLITNPSSNILGIYKLSLREASFYTGIGADAIKDMLNNLSDLGVIIYSPKTGEVAIKNYLKYAIINGGYVVKRGLERDMKLVRERDLLDAIMEHLQQVDGLNTTVTKIVQWYVSGGTDDAQTMRTDSTSRYEYEYEDEDIYDISHEDEDVDGHKYEYEGAADAHSNAPSRLPETAPSKYGKYGTIILTAKEMESLKKTRPNDWSAKLQRVDDWLHDHPNRTIKNHYQTILKWAAEDDAKPKPAPDAPGKHFALENPNYGGTISKYTVDLFADDEEEHNE